MLSAGTQIPIIDHTLCRTCRVCNAAQHCRHKALARLDRDEAPYIVIERCTGCGECVRHCPAQAIQPPSHPTHST